MGYTQDPWCAKLSKAQHGLKSIIFQDGLWYVQDCLVIPRYGSLCTTLFHLAHDVLGHLGGKKNYELLHHSYFWPRMCTELTSLYVPRCVKCQHNKSTFKKTGSLHPVPVPEQHFQALAMDFIGHWYCDHSLPLSIVSNRDKLFVSEFWCSLHHLTTVRLQMPTAFHPQTNGACERTNKTVIQCHRFLVNRQQHGWVSALPHICFALVNF